MQDKLMKLEENYPGWRAECNRWSASLQVDNKVKICSPTYQKPHPGIVMSLSKNSLEIDPDGGGERRKFWRGSGCTITATRGQSHLLIVPPDTDLEPLRRRVYVLQCLKKCSDWESIGNLLDLEAVWAALQQTPANLGGIPFEQISKEP